MARLLQDWSGVLVKNFPVYILSRIIVFFTKYTHVNMKRKINALKRDLTIKRVETQLKTFSRRMQTRFDMRPIDNVLERVWTQFFCTTRLNTSRKKNEQPLNACLKSL